MTSPSSARRIGALSLALLGAACADVSGPLPVGDFVVTSTRLLAVDSALAAPALPSLKVLGPLFSPPRTASQTFPDSVLGRTFEWDTASDRYVRTARAGAPRSAVRFILYGVHPPLRGPVEPLVETGLTDLASEGSGASVCLRTMVRGPGGTPTQANYLVSALFGTSAYTVTGDGFVSNGRARTDVHASFTADKVSDGADISLDLQAQRVHIRSTERTEYTNDTSFTYRATLRLQGGPDTLTMSGTVTVVQTTPRRASVIVDLTFGINGRVFATVQGTDSEIAGRRPDERPLTGEEERAINLVFAAPGRIHAAVGGLVQLSLNLLTGR